jgi:hypothetical protein
MGSLLMVGCNAPLRGGPLPQKALKHALRHPDQATALADLDPELHGLPLGIAAEGLGGQWLGNDAPRAMLSAGAVNRSRNEDLGEDRVRRSKARARSARTTVAVEVIE